MNWHPFTFYPGAVGITLWKWNRKKIELWWASKNCSPPEHAHDGCSGEFMVLYSKNRRIYRRNTWQSTLYKNGICHERVIGPRDQYIATTPQVWGKWLTVPAGVPHKFDRGDSMMIWITVETWRPGYDMDLTKDFRLTE